MQAETAMNDESWYLEWFDSPYYHLLYDNRDETEARDFVHRLFSFLRPSLPARVLDAGCGSGRHARVMNELGFEVTGIDLSPANITRARRSENDTLSFFVHDMRRTFRVNYFDYAFNLFTSFGYFRSNRDNVRVIDSLHSALKKDGILVLDFFNSSCVEKMIASCNSGSKISGGIEFTWKKKIVSGFIEKEIRFSDKGKDFHFTEHVRLLKPDDFRALFENKFSVLHTFGDYRLAEFNEDESPRLIFIAKKN
ncbi:MAG TPA: methyltransferase domain-containing protein [Bacteroidia bacterium]|nr:methyltransferase domain-containing protein [Bacteroidia bacterium]